MSFLYYLFIGRYFWTEKWFFSTSGPESYTFQDSQDAVRGGTPFVLYKYPYYLSVAHGTFFRDCPVKNSRCDRKRFYSTHIIVMTLEPKFKILYISRNIPFPEASLNIPIVRHMYIEDPFFFPVGLILESSDSIILGGHINDHSSTLFRITGLSSVLDDVITYHENQPYTHGPRLGSLHQYARSAIQNETGYQFHSIWTFAIIFL